MALSLLHLFLRIGCTKVPGKEPHYTEEDGEKEKKKGRERKPQVRNGKKNLHTGQWAYPQKNTQEKNNRTTQSRPK